MKATLRVILVMLFTGAGFSLVGCNAKSPEEQAAGASMSLAAGDSKAAIVQLKSALQGQPRNAEWRLMLGRALFESGAISSAVVELEKSLELGSSEDAVVPTLASALLSLGQPAKVIERFAGTELHEPRAVAKLKVTLAAAYSVLQRRKLASSAVSDALNADPTNETANIMRASELVSLGKIDDGLVLLQSLIGRNSRNYEALQIKGAILLRSKGDELGAASAFREALSVKPTYIQAHESLIGIALRKKDIQGMKAQVDALSKAVPLHPQTKYYQALVAFIDGDFVRARGIVEPLLNTMPKSLRLLYLAGAIETSGGSAVQAERHLGKALSLAPGFDPARLLLAQNYLRLNQPEKALAASKPLIEGKEPNASALAIAAEAHLAAGDAARSEALFQRAAKVRPEDPKLRTGLAVSHLANGQVDSAFDELQALSASDPSIYADLVLVSARWARKEFDKALEALATLERKQPKRAFVLEQRGRLLLAKGDSTGARDAFERALGLDPKFFPAIKALAMLDVGAGKLNDAKQRLDEVLRSEPNHGSALLARASIEAAADGKSPQVEVLLRRAVSANPGDEQTRMALIRHLYNQGNFKSALAEAQLANASIPDSTGILEVLGSAQMKSGQLQQALSTFGQLAERAPKSPLPLVRQAETYILLGNTKMAADSFKRALQVSPDHILSYQGLIAIAVGSGKVDEAIRLARMVQQERSKDAVGYLLEGDIHAKRARWDDALTAYRAGLQKTRSTQVAVKVHDALLSAGRRADGDRFEAEWIKERPDDYLFQSMLGMQYLERGEYSRAEAAFRSVMRLRPKLAAGFNNAAFAVLMQGKGGALELARRANELSPESPETMHTLALTLLAEGKVSEAVEVQKRAVALRPDDGRLRLTLAKAYIVSGNKSAAKRELEPLLKMGERFAAAAEVAELMKGL